MQPTDDSAWLREYAESNSEEAFAALVTRYINLVYSVAMRSVGNPAASEEITQAVFIILARKSAQLRNDKALSSWLFKTTQLTANNFLRSEMRRQSREQEAHDMQTILNEPEPELWPRIAPLLDNAVAALNEKDRRAILLRFYEGKNLREIGNLLGSNEPAAEKRVSRALEKLRKFFTKRGVTLSSVAIAGAISANSVQAAPVALAKSVTAVAIVKGAAASASTLTLIKGALKIMAWTKMKTAIVAGVVVLLAAGTATVIVKEIQDHKSFPIVPWQSVGKVQKGMTVEQVEAVLGKPDEVRVQGNYMIYEKHFGFSVICDSNRGVTAVLCRGSTPQLPLVKDFNGRTKEDIGIASSRADIIKAYGQPTLAKPLDGDYESLEYDQIGLNFLLSNGKIYDISVSFLPRIAQPVSDGLLTRTYKPNAEIFIGNLRRIEAASNDESIQQLALRYFKDNGIETNSSMSIFWIDKLNQLFVRCKAADQDKIEKLLVKLNNDRTN